MNKHYPATDFSPEATDLAGANGSHVKHFDTWGYFYIESGELIGHDSSDVMAWAAAHPDYAGSILFDYGTDECQTEVRGIFYPEDEDVEAMITRPAATVAGSVNLLTAIQERAA